MRRAITSFLACVASAVLSTTASAVVVVTDFGTHGDILEIEGLANLLAEPWGKTTQAPAIPRN